jgi:hypothetical protein
MTNYNLDEDATEFFPFTLGGKEYKMRYPTTEEVEKSRSIKTDEKRVEWLYSFIEPVTEGAPPVRDVLKAKNIKVLQKFNKMILTEFSETGE